jgi:8-oxo-dGTP pyrophosphatase MutT (NUDIX family)
MPEQIPTDARPSAVVLILYPVADEIYMLLMKRATDGRAHSGQISMPGGRWEKTDRTLADTALREAWEEVGLLRDDAEILGELTPLYIPISNFMMHPYVAYLPQRPDWQPSPVEVAEIIEVPLTWLMKGGDKTDHEITSPIDSSWVRVVPAYTLPDGQIVWGATAMVLSELEVLMINNANDPVC